MAKTALGRSAASVTPFAPAAWLSRFRDAGGYWMIDSSGRASFGWQLNNDDDPCGDIPRGVWKELEADPAHRNAVREHLRAQAGEVPSHG